MGRRRTLLVASSMTVISAVMYSVYSFDPEVYLPLSRASDLMAGLGNGLAICTVPVLIAETSPAKIRKLISALFWFSMSSGQMMIVCLGIEVASPLLAPTFYLLSQAVALFFVFGICESPLWYMHGGQMDRAFASYRRLRSGTEILAARELYQSHIIHMDGDVSGVGTTYRLLDFVRVSKIRRNTLGSLVAMISGGLDLSLAGALLSVMTDGYTQEGVAEPFFIFSGYALFMMFPSFLGTSFIKKRYSKVLRLYPVVLLLLAVMALLFERLNDSGAPSGVMILVTLVSVGLSPLGPGLLPFPYMTDAFPASHRDVGIAFSLMAFFGTQYASQRFYDSLLWSRAFGFVGRWSILILLYLIPVLLFMSVWKKSAVIKGGTPSFGFSIRIIFASIDQYQSLATSCCYAILSTEDCANANERRSGGTTY
ncbi:Major facilitator superfamily domain, general substrate transporter [Penicillium occitanis (nom. inval.)]|nr:Major facilitator superfamily domain, general substrate transporter [Penicillium occitanis (nom. inval.)]PCH08984.1 hypothetical protein PENOC_011540 [Penicillium occitanis (nom. inval.)]